MYCRRWRGLTSGRPESLGLTANTHCEQLPVICDSIPVLDVFCRATHFINCCLNSSSETVSYVTRHGVSLLIIV